MNADTQFHPDSPLTIYELAQIGEALLSWAHAVERLGHASPNSTLDYTTSVDSGAAYFVRDFVAWTANRQSASPGCVDRIRDYLAAVNWDAIAATRINDALARSTAS